MLQGRRRGLSPDPELLYVGAMFHDLGPTEKYRTKDQRFEIDGADQAREFLAGHGVNGDEARRVWTAIALHTTPGIPEHLEAVASWPVDPPLAAAAARLAAQARRVASVCTGAFVLAAAGLLDGRRATTHWRHAAALQRRHAGIRVEPDAIFVTDGPVVTSAGITAGIDLTLALIEHDHGAALARDVARSLVVFLQRPGGQSQFSVAVQTPAPDSGLLRRLIESIAADPAGSHTVPELAAAAGTSVRHLTRLFRSQLDTTPARHVEQVRLEHARMLLDSGHSVTSAARHSGFGSDENLRRAFHHYLKIAPTVYQHRFTTTATTPP